MVNLCSDNVSGALPEVLAAIQEAGSGPAMPYGNDPWTRRLTDRLAEVFEREVAVFPVATGSAANALSLALLCPPWGKIFCHEEAHGLVDECGAVGFYSGGGHLCALPGTGGKLTPAEVTAAVGRYRNDVHQMQPAAVTITNVTEHGALYSVAEITALSAACREQGMRLHMDGARFANAVAALGVSPAEATWKAGVDILSLGGTKGGCLAGEAVVVFDPALAGEAGFRRKRAGHLFSKMRLVSSQLLAWVSEDRWLRAAGHANGLAQQLAEGLAPLPGVRLFGAVEANMLFLEMPEPLRQGLLDRGHAFYPWEPLGPDAIRLVTSFETPAEEVADFLADARDLTAGPLAATG